MSLYNSFLRLMVLSLGDIRLRRLLFMLFDSIGNSSFCNFCGFDIVLSGNLELSLFVFQLSKLIFNIFLLFLFRYVLKLTFEARPRNNIMFFLCLNFLLLSFLLRN
jgi:hypothetical protein